MLFLILLFAKNIITLKEFWIYFCVSYLILVTSVILSNYSILKGILEVRAAKSFQSITSKELILFMCLAIFGASIASITTKIDILMITGEMGEKYTGVYGLALYLLSLIDIPKRSLSSILSPIISKNIHQGFSSIKPILKKSSINLLLTSSLMISLLLANLDSFYKFIPKGDFFSLGFYPILIMSIAKILDGMIGVSAEIIAFSKHYWINVTISVISLILAVLLNNILIPKYGLNGAACATLIALSVSKILRLLTVILKFKITPFSKNYFISLFIALGVIAFAYKLNISIPPISSELWVNTVATVFVNSIVVFIVFLITILLLKPSQDIHQFIILSINEVKKRF